MAFDIAPYAVLDHCVLQPWRVKLAELERERVELSAANASAQREFDDVSLQKEQILMILADGESHACEEGQVLHATRAMDSLWSDHLTQAKEELALQRSECKRYQNLLEDEEEALATAWRNQFQKAQGEQNYATERLVEATELVERTERELGRKQQVLDHQCGLLAAARELPNDADLQSWVLASIRALAEGLDDESQVFTAVDDGTDEPMDLLNVQQFLYRDETLKVILDAMTRFAKTRCVHLEALTCLISLIRSFQQQQQVGIPRDTSRNASRHQQQHELVALLLKANALPAVRDAVVNCEKDLEIFQRGFEVMHYIFSNAGANKAVVQLCQNKRNQLLPIEFVSLLQDQEICNNLEFQELSASRLHVAHFLFTLAKYNVKKSLLDAGVVSLILTQIDKAAINSPQSVSSLDAIRCFLATLAILHAIASPSEQRRTGTDTNRTLDHNSDWREFQAQDLVDSLQGRFADPGTEPDGPSSLRLAHDELRLWLLKLLRNLVWHRGAVAEKIREAFGVLKNFQMVANTVSCDPESQQSLAEIATTRTQDEEIAIELVQAVWIARYDDEGRLLTTPKVVLHFLVSLLGAKAMQIGLIDDTELLLSLETLMEVLALVASNGELAMRLLVGSDMNLRTDYCYCCSGANLEFLGAQQCEIDRSMQMIMAWIYQLHDAMARFEPTLGAVIAHTLCLYLGIFQHELTRERVPAQRLHSRCKQIGLCAIVRELGFITVSAGDSVGDSELMRSVARFEDGANHTSERIQGKPERRSGVREEADGGQNQVLRALARSIDKCVRCTC